MTKKRPRTIRGERQNTRESILEAAEQEFAAKGFTGATVRDIFARASVNSGLMSYYFSGKDALFAEVIERRLPEMQKRFDDRVEAALATYGDGLSVEDAFYTYAFFLLELAADRDSGWGHYIRLLAQSSALYEMTPVTDLLDRFKPIILRFRALVCKALPHQTQEEIARVTFYMEAAITTVIVSGHLIHERLPYVDASHPEAIARDIARFFATRLDLAGANRSNR